MFGRAFGKNLDHTIKETPWFKDLSPFWRTIVENLLNFTHHFQYGLIMMIYWTNITEVYWFGYGLVVDDGPDIPKRFIKYFGYITGE